jgi:hypothetical protein
MESKMHAIHFKADQKLLNFIQEKLDKLEIFNHHVQSAEVFLRLDKDKEKDKNQKDKDNKDGNNDKKENKDQNQGKPQPQPGGISKQRLQNLLDAVNNEEKKIQDKVNKQKIQANPKKAEKDW